MPSHSDTPEYAESTLALQPKHLNSRHRALMRRLVAGERLKDAAEVLGYTESRASLIVNSGLFQDEMKRMQSQVNEQFIDAEATAPQTNLVRQRLSEEAAASVETLVAMRDNATSEDVKVRSAKDLLDRAGYRAPLEVESRAVTVEMNEGLVNALRAAISEMKNGSSKSS